MTRLNILILTIVSFTCASGCTAINLSSLWRERTVLEDARHPVSEVMCLWEPAEGTGLDGLPTRGFAGQILFFTSNKTQPSPLKVEGDVRIFVFDDEGVRGDKAQPIHQFDFPGAAWNAFMTSSNFGTTYQIFIPYTKRGSHMAECEIRVRYTAEGGRQVYSRPCTVTLTGTPRVASTARANPARRGLSPSMIQQASHEVEVGAPAVEPKLLPIPPSLSSLAAASNAHSKALQVNRLNHLADSLAEEKGTQNPVRSTLPDDAPLELPASTRRRLNPLTSETPVAVPETPIGSAELNEERAKHILLCE